MSKPVTNVEIEDVLSSIRRLVSTSDRVERGEGDAPADVADKLVLTPALRVDEATDDASDEADNTVEDQDLADVAESSDAPVDLADEAPEEGVVDAAEEASDEAFFEKIAESVAPDEAAEMSEDANGADVEIDAAPEAEDSLDALDAILSETNENSNEIEDVAPDMPDATDALVEEGENPPEARVLEDHERMDGADESADDEAANNLQRRAAEFEAIIATTDDAWDPDGTTEDDNAASPVGPLPWQEDGDDIVASEEAADDLEDATEAGAGVDEVAKVGDIPEDAVDHTDDAPDMAEDLAVTPAEDAVDEAAAEETAEDDDADLARVMADLARARAPEGVEPAAESAEQAGLDGLQEMISDPDPTPFVFRSQSSVRLADDAGDVADDAGDTDEPLAIEEAMLDEEALRDMVSEIVRQELQGALGERITRNVRKLVRREIHRALASQELE